MACPLDRVNRPFKAPQPNALWVSDFTYVAASAFRAAKAPGSGFVYVAFIVEPSRANGCAISLGSPDIDAYARRIVGWRVSRTAHAGFMLDALEQALHERRLVHSETSEMA